MIWLNLAVARVVVVSMKMIFRPTVWVIAMLAAAFTAIVPTVPVPAHAAGLSSDALLKVKSGNANLCLDPQAQQALTTAGIGMSVGAPAQLLTTGPQPCATAYVSEGAVSLGLTGGNFPFHGTIGFMRASDGARLTLSDISVTFAVPSTVSAVVNGDTANPITLLSFVPLPNEIMTDGQYLIAHDVPLMLTDAGARAFATVFGTSPVSSGKTLFVGTGSGQLEAGTLPLVPALG